MLWCSCGIAALNRPGVEAPRTYAEYVQADALIRRRFHVSRTQRTNSFRNFRDVMNLNQKFRSFIQILIQTSS